MSRRPGIRRGGFSLIEMLIVVVTLGILAGIAVPNFQRAILKAEAADILGDLNTVRVAYHQYLADGGGALRNAAWGQPPAALVPHLPDNFSFSTDVADYRWIRVRERSSPWGVEMGELRVRPNQRFRTLLLDRLEGMANQEMTLRRRNNISLYILP